ncbi:FecR domain-containing protein [Sphingobacterium sp.]|uniref:FecR family protein n=1 Tax=Sphingobacterium sp. TaxID=341027 RepID=UPI00258FBACC|nr:FecR domain-containing protein [Sphingobacterium sp.]WET67013.1 MAG: FecR domain-containing protein [Sphingobacterium sp.]
MDKEKIRSLLEKYRNGTCSPEEKALFESLSNRALEESLETIEPLDLQQIKQNIYRKIQQQQRQPRIKKVWPYAVAAACLAFLFIGYFMRSLEPAQNNLISNKNNLHSEKDKTVLTLADGSKIALNDADIGQLVEQDGIVIQKTKDGMLTYTVGKQAEKRHIGLNTIETPRGNMYHVILPDGSSAWLNARSSLTYPTSFSGSERRVKMTGEVYFEIAKVVSDKHEHLPFFVETETQEIKVLGTHFNVSAYPDEPLTTTTLIEGSVKVIAKGTGKSVVLQPGQQARLGSGLDVSGANIEGALAWKAGEFYFDNEDLASVLKKIARWYDVEIECPPLHGKTRVTAIFPRNQPLSNVMESLGAVRSVKMKYHAKERRVVVEE